MESIAARLLTRLKLRLFDDALLGEVRRARALRSLGVLTAHAVPSFEALLEAPPHLEELAICPVARVTPAAWLGRLRALELVCSGELELGELVPLQLARLERLALDVNSGPLRTRSIELADALPSLRELSVIVPRARAEHALNILIRSRIVTRLQRLRIGDKLHELTDAERRSFRGGALAHIERVELPVTWFINV